MLIVHGRKTSHACSAPVSLVEENGQRCLVAPYGEVSWVRNARAAGEVRLSRGSKTERLKIRELDPQESAPILKKYLTRGRQKAPQIHALRCYESDEVGFEPDLARL